MAARSLLSSFHKSEEPARLSVPAPVAHPVSLLANQALASASSSSSSSLNSRVALLPGTPTVIIEIIAKYLLQKELPNLLATNHQLRAKITQTLNHLNLDSPRLNDQTISVVIQQFPQLTSLRLARCPNISKYGLTTIFPWIDGSRVRSLKRLEIKEMDRVLNADKTWLRFFEALNFSQLEVLSCPGVFAGVESSVFMRLLVTKFTGNKTLQQLEINRAVFSLNRHIAISLISVLPNTLATLNFPQIEITDKLADRIMSSFSPELITHCHLRFNSSSIAQKKMMQLLRFLPLTSMKSISLCGNAIDEEAIDYIRAQLKVNRHLETLNLLELERQIPTTSFELLIQDIKSNRLHTICLNTTITAFLNHLLYRKKPQWPQLIKVYFRDTTPREIPRLTLSNARSILHSHQALRARVEKGTLRDVITTTEAELIVFAETLLSSLAETSIEVILNHYTCLHNTIDLGNQLNSEELLDRLSPKGVGAKHLSQLSKIGLIANLEYIIEFEKDRLDKAPNAQDKLLRMLRYTSMMQSLTNQEIGPNAEGLADV